MGSWGSLAILPAWGAGNSSSNLDEPTTDINESKIDEYISTISNKLCVRWVYEVKRFLIDYSTACNFIIDVGLTNAYLTKLKANHSLSYYSKIWFQIHKFILYVNPEIARKISFGKPDKINYEPVKITDVDYQNAINEFKHDLQIKTVLMIGYDSGIRAEELMQLTMNDIDIVNRIIYVKYDKNHTTKTKKNRVTFFTKKTQKVLIEYLKHFNNQKKFNQLFGKSVIHRKMRKSSFKLKFTRKVFSSNWDKKLGPTSIKKLIMGHAVRDIDLSHYNYQDANSLKQIYDKIMGVRN